MRTAILVSIVALSSTAWAQTLDDGRWRLYWGSLAGGAGTDRERKDMLTCTVRREGAKIVTHELYEPENPYGDGPVRIEYTISTNDQGELIEAEGRGSAPGNPESTSSFKRSADGIEQHSDRGTVLYRGATVFVSPAVATSWWWVCRVAGPRPLTFQTVFNSTLVLDAAQKIGDVTLVKGRLTQSKAMDGKVQVACDGDKMFALMGLRNGRVMTMVRAGRESSLRGLPPLATELHLPRAARTLLIGCLVLLAALLVVRVRLRRAA
jgi:hypothetical protein